MTDTARDAAHDDEDRLPWLEAVDDETEDTVGWGKLAGLIVAALVALGIVIGGVYLLRQQSAPPVADPKLIAAQEGDYKVPPENPGGMKVEGRGDTAFEASEGAEANGKIDLNKLPETPVKSTKGTAVTDVAGNPAPTPPPTRTAQVAMPKASAPLVAKPPVVAPAKPAGGGGRMVQLGSFGSEDKANQAWAALSKKFAYLSALPKSVATAQVGGSTVYRLQAAAGDQSAAICGKLKAAGENCLPVGTK